MGINRSAMKIYFTGSVGGIIQYEVRGQLRVRSCPNHVANPRTAPQTAHRNLFGLASSFVRSIGSVYKIGYAAYNTDLSPRANFVHQVYTSALQPNLTIDPTLVLIARGPLPKPLGITLSRNASSLHLHWQRPTNHNLRLSATLYDYSQALSITYVDCATSLESSTSLLIPSNFSTDSLYIYLFWRNPSTGAASDSIVLPLTSSTDTSTLDTQPILNRLSLISSWPSYFSAPQITTTSSPSPSPDPPDH